MNISNSTLDVNMVGIPTSLLVITCFFVFISVIGTIGNSLVLLVIQRLHKHGKRSNVHIFLLHLALSDLLVCIVCIPLTIAMNFISLQTDDLGSVVACKTSRFVQFLSPTISTMILTVISIDRYCAMVKPLQKTKSILRNPKIMVCIAWTVSVILFLPTLYFTDVKNITLPNNITVGYCTPIPYNTPLGYGFLMFVAIVCFVLPVTTLSIMYGMIVRVVWFRHRELSVNNANKNSEVIFRKSKIKVLRMLMIVVVAFICCWLPFVIYCGFVEVNIAPFPNYGDVIRIATYSLGLFNSILNPFIYFFSNGLLRRACIDLVCCRKFEIPSVAHPPASPAALAGKRIDTSTRIVTLSPNLSSRIASDRKNRGYSFSAFFHLKLKSTDSSPMLKPRVKRPESLPSILPLTLTDALWLNGSKYRSDNMLGIPKKQMPTRTTLEAERDTSEAHI